MRRLRWYLLLPAVPVIVAVAAALLAPWVAPSSPTSGNLAARLRPPAWVQGGSVQRLLGTDLLGRDLLSRLVCLSLRERDYVQAARALGARTPRILFRHLLPEILSVILILATFDVGRIIILESTLSFLGLGVQPPTPSWGSDLRDAAAYVRQAWWTSVFPGLAIMVVVLGVNLVGDALRDALDPRTQSRARA